ncbi:MAG: putative metal-binding motif-containing protein, partial [Deltaproteobacteria bacterium]|nr:putative metal-binding motif-containing protein [Deltaproteobacteria bacterium]
MRPSLPLCLALLSLGLAACNDEEPEDTGTPSQDDTGVDDTAPDDTGTGPVDEDRDGYTSDVDCNDNDWTVHPDAEELCDSLDNDCDGAIDEDFDLDGDGQATCAGDCNDEDATIYTGADETPYDGVDQDCDGADLVDVDGDGFRGVEAGGNDCDDSDPGVNPRDTPHIFPGAPEYCDGEDNDCDGEVDEIPPFYFIDADIDGYGDTSSRATSCDFPKGPPKGWTLDGTDCDDTDPLTYPGAPEIWYDGVDQDCAGGSDYDADVDGYESADYSGDDCDDFDPEIHPDAGEYCDGVDNDCDGETDPDTSLDVSTWYFDADGDTYGDPKISVVTCYAPEGYVDNDDDCDDTDSEILRCTCTLVEVSEPTTWVRSGSTYGQWMADPLET